MTESNQEKISVREFARRIHVSEGAIRKAIEAGKIKDGYDPKDKRVIFSIAYIEYGQNKTVPKAGHGVSKSKIADKLHLPDQNSAAIDDAERQELEDMSYDELIKQLKITSTLSYKESLRRGEIINIAQEKIKLEELQGNLVRKVDVDKVLFTLGSDLKTRLQNIPNRSISMIRSAATDIEATNLLIFEINQVLDEFANKI